MGKFFSLMLGILLFNQIVFAEESDMSTEAIEQRVKPIGQVQVGAPPVSPTTTAPVATTPMPVNIPPAPAGTSGPAPAAKPPTSVSAPAGPAPAPGTTTQAANEGEKIYKSYCFACHATGAAGAPKFGDAAAWAPRISEGIPILVSHAVSGYKLMPPKGTCMTCTNDQIAAAVKYMISNSQKK